MHRFLLILGLAIAQAFPMPASAAEQPALPSSASIAAASSHAFSRAPTTATLVHRRAEADAVVDAATRWAPGPPSVGLAARGDRLTGRNGQQEWELELATPLWLPGQRDARLNSARSRQSVIEADVAALHLEIAGQVREAWGRLASARDSVAVAARRLQSAQALQADVERRWRAGDLSRLDANSARSETQAAEGEVLEAQGEQRRAETAWQLLTGTVAAAEFAEESVAADAPALDTHPRLRAAQAAIEAAQAHLRLAERSRREAPELALRWVRERGSTTDAYASTLGVQLRIPLSFGPTVTAELSAARAELAQAAGEHRLLREQLQRDARSARQQLESIDASSALTAVRGALAADSLQLLEKSFALGESDLPALLRARADALAIDTLIARQTRARSAAISSINQSLGVLP